MVTGKERILAALRCEETDRAPWVPFVGCHGGHLQNLSAEEYLKDEELVVAGVQKAIELYQPDGIPVVFDLQIEAETFGCGLQWAKDNPPSVTTHPLAGRAATLDSLKIPEPTDGRIPIGLNAAKRLREANPDIALYGLITGPFTLTLHLMGTEIFMHMFDDPAYVKEVMEFSSRVAQKMAEYYVEAGCDVVAAVDPMTSQIGPDQFRDFVTPYILPVFEGIRKKGAMSSFFVCGHAQQNIKAMCECRPDNVSIDENISLDYVRNICTEQGISFGGNLQLTTVLLLGTPDDCQRNAIECLEIGGNKGFILAPGCDLPYATPSENLEGIHKIVADPYERDILKAKAVDDAQQDLMDMRDYGQTDKVIVDIITLDSEGCAPCQYMVESVKQITPEFEGIVEWREHKIKYREALVFMTSLMVKNIPTICIDGKITFVSRIPAREELIAAIQKRIYEKMRMSIKRRKARIYVLAADGEQAESVEQNALKAIKELGADVDVQVVADEKVWEQYGVLPSQTPAVVLARYQLKSTQSVPEVAIVKEWIKDLK